MSKSKFQTAMVDISHKPVTVRRAVAKGYVQMSQAAFKDLMTGQVPKGDVCQTARLAGIMAAKNTPQIIPLCHPLLLEKVKVDVLPNKSKKQIDVTAEIVISGKTGVEMEALCAVSAACLTVYDMMKYKGHEMTIKDIALVHKSGGVSGEVNR